MAGSGSSQSGGSGGGKFLDITLKVLSVLVVPLIIWGVKLEVKNAIQDERISELQEDLDKLAYVTDAVQANALAMVRLEGKLDNLDEKIDEVKKLLASTRP
jgi:uncharacterized coiled-coil protein SlyX